MHFLALWPYQEYDAMKRIYDFLFDKQYTISNLYRETFIN